LNLSIAISILSNFFLTKMRNNNQYSPLQKSAKTRDHPGHPCSTSS